MAPAAADSSIAGRYAFCSDTLIDVVVADALVDIVGADVVDDAAIAAVQELEDSVAVVVPSMIIIDYITGVSIENE